MQQLGEISPALGGRTLIRRATTASVTILVRPVREHGVAEHAQVVDVGMTGQ
jgi:hypothetical protein